MPHAPARAYGALVAGVLCIAWSGIFVRVAGVPGVAAAFYRFAIATVVLAPWCVARAATWRRMRPRALLLATLAGAFFACDNGLFNVAVQDASVSLVTLLANTSPIFVAIVMWVFVGRRPVRSFWLGLLLAAVGSAIVLGTAVTARSVGAGSPTEIRGDLLAILAAACFGAYLIATRRARADLDTLTLTTTAVASGAVLLLMACLAAHAPLTGYRPTAWAALLALGLVSQVGGYLGVTYALHAVDATVASVALLGQVPLTAVLAAVVLHESLTAVQLAGGLLVLVGIYVVMRPSR